MLSEQETTALFEKMNLEGSSGTPELTANAVEEVSN